MSRILAVSCTALALLTVPARSAAEPVSIQIIAGSLDMRSTAGALTLTGDAHGFTLDGSVHAALGIFGPFNTCTPCSGTTFSLNSLWSGLDLRGAATFQGEFFSPISGFQPEDAFGTVRFFGTAPVPSEGLTATVAAPFTFRGEITFPASASRPQTEAHLFGLGTATIQLSRPNTEIGFSYRSAAYEFEPVPEPGTIVLVGTVLGGLGLRRRLMH